MNLKFLKMNGLGNDFVIFDFRGHDISPDLSEAQIKHIADRRYGIGCDQLIVISDPRQDEDVFMQIYNADGSQVDACGNATRCVARIILDETPSRTRANIRTNADLLIGEDKDGLIQVDMNQPRLQAMQIPLSQEIDTTSLPIEIGDLKNPIAVNMGNPHMIFFVDNVDAVDINTVGPELEHHPLFPKRTNVSFVQVKSPTHLRLRVWERGAGVTGACGTAACATTVGAHLRGHTDRKIQIDLDGGTLHMHWDEKTNHVFMTGAATRNFTGEIVLND